MLTFGDQFRLTLITNDPALSAKAELSGINRVGIDLEYLGKAERQTGHDVRLSDHKVEHLAAIAGTLAAAKPFARINPLNPDSPDEVEKVLQCGAKVLMLPYFRTAEEVDRFVRLVRGRAFIVILLETASALIRIREIISVPGIGEIMIGLNDLRFEMRVESHFEILASPLLDRVATEVRQANLLLSLGGLAVPGDHSLPIPPDLVLAQYPRLGATGAWISRSLLKSVRDEGKLEEAVALIRRRLTDWSLEPMDVLERARNDLGRAARDLRCMSCN